MQNMDRLVKIWMGRDLPAWLRLLRCAGPGRDRPPAVLVAIGTFLAGLNSVWKHREKLLYGKDIERTRIVHPPLFIIGHWRTGTTLLHELLALDERHTFPTYYRCFAPHHFVLTERIIPRLFGFLLPERRPMDMMSAAWHKPQEDEFAVCNMGLPSPYPMFAYPGRMEDFRKYFLPETLDRQSSEKWERCFMDFLTRITFRDPKRIILKSPTHTFRIRRLLELFPDALFVHIVRNPFVVFPSTVHLLKSLCASQRLNGSEPKGVESFVFDTFDLMQARLEETRDLIPESRFFELKYENLVRDPVGQMKTLYERLRLGDFDVVEPAIVKYMSDKAEYRTNRYSLSADLWEEIARRWGYYAERYGYETQGS